MRSSSFVNKLILVSIFAAPSCMSGDIDSEATLGSSEIESLVLEDLPHEVSSAELDADGTVITEALPCGLSVRIFARHTDYWIRNCSSCEVHVLLITFHEGQLYSGRSHDIMPSLTASGSVAGRVLRLRRR